MKNTLCLIKKLFNLGYHANSNSEHFYKYVGKWIITIDINRDLDIVRNFSVFMSIFDNITCQRDVFDLQRAYNLLMADLGKLGVLNYDN